MTATARAARPEETDAVLEILCQAFGLDVQAARPIFYADPFFDLACKRVLPLPGVGIVSCLTVVPTLLRVGGVPLPAAGIAGVATRPAFQRRGFAASLLAATVPALYAGLGFPVALLHPVSAPFYQKLGWDYASRQVRWLSVPASLPRFPEAAYVRPALDSDWPAIAALHDAQTRGGTGSFQRDKRRWQLIRLPAPGREVFVYEQSGAITGYCVWERQDVLHLLEMEAGADDARRGLAGWVARQPDALVEWAASEAQLDAFGLSGAGLTPDPGVMLRIVNLQAALAHLHPALYAPVLAQRSTALTVCADDALCPENTQPLRLTAGGIAPVDRIDGPWLHADIRVWARLYFGDLLPSDAAAQDLLAADDPQTLFLADRLFPRRQPYVAPLDQF